MNIKRSVALAILSALGAGMLLSGVFVFAETVANPAVVGEKRAQLEAELKNLETEIDSYRNEITAKQKETVSLERDVAILDAEIKQAQLAIKARTLTMNKLQEQIGEKNQVIGALSDKYTRELQSLGEMLRELNELSDISEVELVFKYDDLSKYFEQVDSFDYLQKGLQDSFDVIRATKEQTETERAELEDRRQEESDLREIQLLEKRRTEQREAERKDILKLTRGKEKEYQKILTSRQQDAAKIRSQLFILQGSAAIPFEKALELANLAYQKTGVRPAFILGIVAEESNLGANVGTGTWRVDMKSPRDTEPFLKITASLGLDPDKMPVSKKAWYGYGGAMGSAQFIPSTWALYAGYDKNNNYEYDSGDDRIGALTGHKPSNPWDPGDAFMASAMLSKDNGAAKGTYNAEFTAAICYLAGCKNSGKRAYAFYGNDVMALAAKYQEQIDILSGK
ncbi:MAG: hypothetical protein HZA25_03220 [Candidatus Niyogibacteria bacterium]|nr:hypothetical protein [Candidatus Niyogibacteria bacterium]